MLLKKYFYRTVSLVLLAFLFCGILFACGNGETETMEKEDVLKNIPGIQGQLPKIGDEIAVITTAQGVIKVMFFPDLIPNGVENFITHAKNGYYDGQNFHRVMQDFMIQGGDPLGTGMGGESIWGKGFMVEFAPELRHYRGALSYARSNALDSQGSQFYIVHGDVVNDDEIAKLRAYGYSVSDEIAEAYKKVGKGVPFLDDNYTVFGQVFEGIDVVDKLAAVQVKMSMSGEMSAPVNIKDVLVKKIEIVKYEG